MKHFIIRGMLATGLAASLASAATAATTSIDCGAGGKLNKAVAKMLPGDTLLVSGICKENLVVDYTIVNAVIDGQGTATIKAPVVTAPGAFIGGRNILLRGFKIIGGADGVFVFDGASAQIVGNTISGAAYWGVQVTGSSARLWGNTIRQNTAGGVLVNNSGNAGIGITYFAPADATPNTISANTGPGVLLIASSSAVIVGNTISNNTGGGIEVWRASSAETASNTIDANGRSGVLLGDNSSVSLGTQTGTGLYNLPNVTNVPNAEFGVGCYTGGSRFGRLGTLRGNGGGPNADSTCVNQLLP